MTLATPRRSSSRRVPPPTAAAGTARGQAARCAMILLTAVGLTNTARSNLCRLLELARRREVFDLDRRKEVRAAARGLDQPREIAPRARRGA